MGLLKDHAIPDSDAHLRSLVLLGLLCIPHLNTIQPLSPLGFANAVLLGSACLGAYNALTRLGLWAQPVARHEL